MHTYATNSPVNRKLGAYLMITATVMATGVSFAVHQINSTLGWTLGGVSAMTLYGALYVLFDRCIWRWPRARALLLVPNLNGTWACEGRTISKTGTPVDYPWTGTVAIRQSWTKIVVTLTTGQSSSRSIAASLYEEPGNGYRLIYHYDNRPGVVERDLSRHTGLCSLLFDEHGKSASGDYFSDKDRMTVGTMRLQRKGKTK